MGNGFELKFIGLQFHEDIARKSSLHIVVIIEYCRFLYGGKFCLV
jgi:hypothetical protein